MARQLNQFVADLQATMDERVQAEFGSAVFKRWLSPPHEGRLDHPSCSGFIHGSCGDSVVIDLAVEDGRIIDAGFWSNGCGSSVVSCSACCELAIGRTIGEAATIKPRDVLEKLGGLPPENRHCAGLAAHALENGLEQLVVHQ